MAEACPKCGKAVDPARTHCAACGLAHARMAAYAKQRDDIAEPLANAWQQAVDDWSNRAKHDELLRLVSQHDAYAWAAARYRERDDGKDHLDRIRRAAEATLATTRAVRDQATPGPYRNTILILAIFILAIVAGLVYAKVRGSDPPRRVQPPGATK